MEKRILNKLNKLFTAANWEPIEITMKSTGLKIKLTPYFDDYGETPDPRDIEHCAFIAGYGEQDALWYTGKPMAVAGYLKNHDEIHRRWLVEAENLRKMAEAAQGNWSEEDWSDYSDLYKDTYGYRPCMKQ